VTFAEYVAARGGALVRFARLLTGDEHRAEDVVQEVLARAYLRWNRIMRTDRPDLYLRRMVINTTNSWWRLRSSQEIPVNWVADRPQSAGGESHVVERDAIWRLLHTLSRQQRAVLVLRYYEDLDDTTIAEILECEPATPECR